VLANRLTADGKTKVLVLEAGGDNKSMNVKVPAGLTRLFQSVLDWNLYSNRQQQLDDRNVYMARGKLLGGSSATNATLYHRGTRQDYEQWNMPGWAPQDILPWFVKCENNPDIGVVEGVHGTNGTMHVENPRYHHKLHDVFFQAAKEHGIPYNRDFNNWSTPQEGHGEFQVTQEKGERADMHRQYLKPALGRPNLKVVTRAKTLKLEHEMVNGKPVVKAVRFSVKGPSGMQHTAEVRQGGEVLLCAGAVHSPHLLQVSGFGPAQQLQEHDIPVVADLPGVGKNLQDHPACLSAFSLPADSGMKAITDEIYHSNGRMRTRAVLNYFLRRKGPLATTGCDHGAFVNTLGGDQPDLQIRFVPGMALNKDGISAYVDFAQLKKRQLKWPSGLTFQLLAVRPKSRGSVALKTSDPWDQPALQPAYLTDAEGKDAATLRNGLRLTRQLAKTQAFQPYVDEEVFPGAGCQSDEELDAYVRSSLHSGNAVVGSCRMGMSAEDGAVVDEKLRVHGVRGLRVIDASVIPVIPGGQTGAATVMIAERAAAFLTASDQQVEEFQQKTLAAVA
jgi:choline dehydrogenase-like flavoprotein